MNGDNVTYIDNFGVEYIAKEIKKFIANKSITTNFYKIKAYDSYAYDFMLNNKRFTSFTNLFC